MDLVMGCDYVQECDKVGGVTVPEDVGPMTVGDIATRYGLTLPAARRWIARLQTDGALVAVDRDLETGAKRYAPEDVQRVWDARPGQGARTDRPRAKDTPPCPSTPPEPPAP